jgi:hypothetical protein
MCWFERVELISLPKLEKLDLHIWIFFTITSKVALASRSATSLFFNIKPMESKIISNYGIPIMSKCGMTCMVLQLTMILWKSISQMCHFKNSKLISGYKFKFISLYVPYCLLSVIKCAI